MFWTLRFNLISILSFAFEEPTAQMQAVDQGFSFLPFISKIFLRNNNYAKYYIFFCLINWFQNKISFPWLWLILLRHAVLIACSLLDWKLTLFQICLECSFYVWYFFGNSVCVCKYRCIPVLWLFFLVMSGILSYYSKKYKVIDHVKNAYKSIHT